MRKKKEERNIKKYMVNEPICIDAAEKRIIEDCSIEINASITVYGTLILRNCSIVNTGEGITVYGVLKIDKCDMTIKGKIHAKATKITVR